MTTFHQNPIPVPPLIRTKIAAPSIPPNFVRRPLLIQKINQGIKYPLTLLTAPAGYGKTNLLVEWARQNKHPLAWLNTDTQDNEISRFFLYFISAFQVLDPHFGDESLDFFTSPKKSGIEIGLTILINEISALDHEIILVLDDFHTINETAILRGLDFLIKNLPANLHLVISSRIDPNLELIALRVKGKVADIGVDDLRFTDKEVRQFLKHSMNLELPPDTIQELENRTEGWVTGLQMAAISLRNHSDPKNLLSSFQGEAHYLVDFLAEEVLDRQPEEIREFLIYSSVLETMSAPLCEAVINPDAQPGYGTVMLNKLEHARLFISALDEKHEWYSYHPLFAEFLHHILFETAPSLIPEMQKRAASWFEQNSNFEKAFQYAYESGDVEWAVAMLDRNIEKIVLSGEVLPMARELAKLPKTSIQKLPRLCLAYAWGSIAAFNLEEARFWIDEVQRGLDQGKVDPWMELENTKISSGSWNISGGLAVCRAALALLSGDIQGATDCSKKAFSLLNEKNPFVSSLQALDDSMYHVLSGDTRKAIQSLQETIRLSRHANNLLVLIIATCQLAEMQYMQGKLDQAWVTLKKAAFISSGPEGTPLPMSGLVDFGFGEILLEQNQLSEAEKYLDRGINHSGSWVWISNLDGMVTLARLRQIQGDFEKSQEIIANAFHTALTTESSQWDDAYVTAIAVRLALRRNDLADAERWWFKGGLPDFHQVLQLENYPYHIYEYLVMTQAELLSALGKENKNEKCLQRSNELLDSLMLEAVSFERVTTQIEIKILQSANSYTLGNIGKSKKALIEALALGEPEGFFRIYLESARSTAELLDLYREDLMKSTITLPSPVFVQKLLDAMTQEVGLSSKNHPLPSKTLKNKNDFDEDLNCLSQREMEVLTLIAEGRSNQEISNQLFLALNTVKRHAYNIYAKLGVQKRTQAVQKARKLGLIP